MEYINVKQASEKWGLSERRITALCRSGRIIGAQNINANLKLSHLG